MRPPAKKDKRSKLDPQQIRIAEAVLFAAGEPLDAQSLAGSLPAGAPVAELLAAILQKYEGNGFHLVKVGGKYTFRTAPDLAFVLQKNVNVARRLSKAALETLAIIAYQQPVTRAEIEEIRGVRLSKGTLDVLLESEWVKIKGRRQVPGRPVAYGTSSGFLSHFGLKNIRDLPGIDELEAAGLLDGQMAQGFDISEAEPGGAKSNSDENNEDSNKDLSIS